MSDTVDAVVIGAGPNGLIAAITLARAGWDVTVLEQASEPGGAVRSEELTLPGYVHDTFSAFYGLLQRTPVFRELELDRRVPWVHFSTPVSASTDPHTAAFIHDDIERTASELEAHAPGDGEAWRELTQWWNKTGTRFLDLMLAPIGAVRPALRFGRTLGVSRRAFGDVRMILAPLGELARERFRSEAARALLTSGISHTDVSVDDTGSMPAAMILAMVGQFHGMPVPAGGAGELTRALVTLLEEAGGTLRTGEGASRIIVERGRAVAVESTRGAVLRARQAVLANTGPRALVQDLVGEDHFPTRYLDGLRRFRYGTGVFKVDLALDGIAPWIVEGLRSTGVVHLTGTLDEMARTNFEANHDLLPAQPMLVVGQQTIGDPSRAPQGGHTLWVETHVPSHPRGDAAGTIGGVDGWEGAKDAFLERVLDRLEAHAPGLRDRIRGVAVHTPLDLQARNPNLVGGDVGGGSSALQHQLVFRPVPGWFRYRTPVKKLYLCSASTHPGGGVHGMCGHNCARRVLRDSWKPAGIVRTAGGARRSPRA